MGRRKKTPPITELKLPKRESKEPTANDILPIVQCALDLFVKAITCEKTAEIVANVVRVALSENQKANEDFQNTKKIFLQLVDEKL